MAKTSLIVTSTAASSGKKLQKTLTDINFAATNDELKNFAQAFYGLSDDTYVESNRVDKINVDTEASGITGGKGFRNIAVTDAAQGETATIAFNITEGESVTPGVFFYTNSAIQILTATAAASDDVTVAKFSVTVPASSGELYVGIREKDAFYADFAFANVE